MRNFLFLILLSLLVFSCKKDKPMPREPVIELVSVGPTNIVQFKDSIEVVLKYYDNEIINNEN